VGTGLRPEELYGLDRKDVDRENGVLRVERVYSQGRLKPCKKSDRQRRRVPLRAKVLEKFGLEGVRVDGTLRLEHARGHELVRDLVDAFPDDVHSITFGKPTLEDVFVRLTGRRLFADETEA